jgi:hypothetical protein
LDNLGAMSLLIKKITFDSTIGVSLSELIDSLPKSARAIADYDYLCKQLHGQKKRKKENFVNSL